MGNRSKKEHFIPKRGLLRRFADTNDRLVVFDKKSNSTFLSNVNDCGCKNNLYEHTELVMNSIEKALSAVDTYKLLDDIEKYCLNPANREALILQGKTEKYNLKFIMILQYLRTYGKRLEIGDDMKDMEKQARFLAPLLMIPGENRLYMQKIIDEVYTGYYPVFLYNLTSIPFVLPDEPVLMFCYEDDPKSMNVNLRMPISPKLQICLVHPESCCFNFPDKTYRNRIFHINEERGDYVEMWNQAGYEKSLRFLYLPIGFTAYMREQSFVVASEI